jgi:cell shape-determining protein MreC
MKKRSTMLNIVYAIFLIFIILFHSYLNLEKKEGFTGIIKDMYNDVVSSTNNITNKTTRSLRQSFRNNKETFQRSYRSMTRSLNKL